MSFIPATDQRRKNRLMVAVCTQHFSMNKGEAQMTPLLPCSTAMAASSMDRTREREGLTAPGWNQARQ